MGVIKSMFLLSLLAISFVPRETEAQAVLKPEWSRLAKCGQVAVEVLSSLATKTIPTIYQLKKCSGFVAIDAPNGRMRITWYLRNIYEFGKSLVIDQPKCVEKLLTSVALLVKPYAEQIAELACLDEDDFII
ncbi:uncharacterized protein Dana_GF13450 [Drosophila ananassae]|uniref:ACP53C14B n=1 Tax=Drosophila ananassae TaxID=7217 RepID=B3MDI8_DROAN|nr:uncharacterized protein LOC6496292 [Drosophila ananassae]EDV37451.1 uncharacterized protein Dana_GF13450 [Drosophila ananassae]